MSYLESIGYKFYHISIIEMQSENNPYGDPDDGCPQEALQDFLNRYPNSSEENVTKGEHNFIIWRDTEKPDTFYANAWSFSTEENEECEFTTYYEFKLHGEKQ